MTDTQRELRRNIQTNLLRLMTREDLTQTDLAEKMNVSITTIHKWVHGQNIPRMDRIDELARILGATRSDILSDKTTDYYTDDETQRIADAISKDKDLRLLFDAARNVSADDLKALHQLMTSMKQREEGGDGEDL